MSTFDTKALHVGGWTLSEKSGQYVYGDKLWDEAYSAKGLRRDQDTLIKAEQNEPFLNCHEPDEDLVRLSDSMPWCIPTAIRLIRFNILSLT